MDFIDDEADVTQDSEVLVPSSQDLVSYERSRPGKRRRLDTSSDISDHDDFSSNGGEYDLPSNEGQLEDDFDNPKSKYDALIHVPAYAESQHNEFVTQVDQPWSSPTAIRGPRWQKKNAMIPSEPASPTRSVQQRPSDSIALETSRQVPPRTLDPIVVDEFDDEDVELIEAIMAEESSMHLTKPRGIPRQTQQPSKSMRQTTLFGMNATQKDPAPSVQSRTHNWPMAARNNEPPTHHKIDKTAMQTWTYPLNVGTIRDYQFNIVHRALFHNILVALPTGLGKTFIAATVMLNYFNWTQESQIVFVAPTKPLVTQQVDACFNIAGVPRSQTTLLTGEIQPAIRAEEWQEKRVFFMTPQTLINDLKTGMADPKKIVLLVVDEAHKATGNYAYVEVVKFLRRFNSSFRVLALTATPGATVEAVQKVVDGLGIARVEIRTEESMDIRSFVHTRNENVELFDNSEEIEMCLDLFATAVRPVLSKVNSLNAYFSNDPKTMTLYGLMKGREQWAKSGAGRNANWGLKSMVQWCFKPLMSLAHNLELLKFHGIGPFYSKMKVFDDEAYSSGKYAKQIVESESYKTLMSRLKAWVNDDNFVGHPKLTYLKEVVLNHFMDAGVGLGNAAGRPPSDTRIMVFAHYRDSAEEIVRVLNKHQPMIRAHVFVGQSGTKGSEGMDQKTQIDIIKKFKTGTFNTIVATSIGEEGLDIGEVDLIVCYDCSKSPIRMLQRMGRTGRKRAGNIVLLLMRGKEERDYHSAKDNYVKMQAIIESGKEFQFHEDLSPRIVPRDIQPVVDKRRVEIPIENTQAGSPEPKRRKATNKKRPAKKFHMPDNVETGFKFLGGGRKAETRKEVAARPQPDLFEASLPVLGRVLLSSKDEEDLERRYTQIAGSEIQFVQAVRLDAFPTALQSFGRTRLVKHSSATARLVEASRAMHKLDRTWDRPTITDFNSLPKTDSIDQTQSRSHQTVETGPKPSILDEQATSNHLSADEDHGSGKCNVNRPFYVSQQSMQTPESDSEDLPDMSQVFKKLSPATTVTDNHRSNRSLKRHKRILSDDSDE